MFKLLYVLVIFLNPRLRINKQPKSGKSGNVWFYNNSLICFESIDSPWLRKIESRNIKNEITGKKNGPDKLYKFNNLLWQTLLLRIKG